MEKGGVNLSFCTDRAETQKPDLQVRVKKIPVMNSYSWSLPQHFLDIKMHVQASCLFLTNDSEAVFPVIISPALEVSTDVRSIKSEIIGMPDAGSFLM